jgi:hypothetical protein
VLEEAAKIAETNEKYPSREETRVIGYIAEAIRAAKKENKP